jgi:hypothetical protein
MVSPRDSIPLCKSSVKETRSMAPAENPNVIVRKRGLGLHVSNPIKLPAIVDRPARDVTRSAKLIFDCILRLLDYILLLWIDY